MLAVKTFIILFKKKTFIIPSTLSFPTLAYSYNNDFFRGD
jgi:hypothetical protein